MSLRIDIKGHITDLKAKLASARSSLSNFGQSVKSKLMGVGAAIAGAFAVTRIIGGIRALANEMDALGKQSKAMDLDVETFQEMAFAARIAGVSTEKLSKSMGAMATFMLQAAQGGKVQLRILKALNLTYGDLARMKPDQQFKVITAAIDGMTRATDRMGISKQVFGRAGVDILNMARSFDQAVAQIRNSGGIIRKEDIEAAERFNDKLELIKAKTKAGVSKSGIFQVISDLADRFAKEGIFDFSRPITEGVLTPEATVGRDIAEQFGQAINKKMRDSAKKGLEEAKLGKTLADDLGNGIERGLGKLKVKEDMFRRIGATAFGNQFAREDKQSEFLRTWLPELAKAMNNVDRKTPEINQGGKY